MRRLIAAALLAAHGFACSTPIPDVPARDVVRISDEFSPEQAEIVIDAWSEWVSVCPRLEPSEVSIVDHADADVWPVESFESEDTFGWGVPFHSVELLDSITGEKLHRIALHEFGHMIGLGHIDEGEGTMSLGWDDDEITDADIAPILEWCRR